MMNYLFLFVSLFVSFSCVKNTNQQNEETVEYPISLPSDEILLSSMVDKNATSTTQKLFLNLYKISRNNIIVGQQDATKRGIGWANEEGTIFNTNRSDIYTLTGKFPGVVGSDFNHITSPNQNAWFQYERQTAQWITIDAYEKGIFNTFSWHYHNPVSLGSFYWNESPVKAVSEILPGGSYHKRFKSDLQTIGNFAKSLIAKDQKLVPFIFRPFHEFDGDWFWWGKSHCTAEEYISLYRFTVHYLRDSLEVHNIIYAWSPDRNFTTETQLLERYPGNEYVDLVGMDNYGDLAENGNLQAAILKLNLLSTYAEKSHKIAALTETGLSNVTISNWFTSKLLNVLKTSNAKLAYVLFWNNRDDSFWVPPVNHPAAEDFKKFVNDPFTLMSGEFDPYK